ncbi:hypothetical protein KK141_10085 [Dyella sp. LX-66]|uniref:hypothetical protein n=1 Tax=unclassified Dyella TaxID=2634549 RepID=UPI001BE0791B|nr:MULTISPECIES: hypothetical protein [unclassified Dyella]MBT2117043.1 hypothetical protein [Dyella sp. LX-1]MBT2139881.1 hypothetical protein [Dyella sp. LX-66]
MRRSLLPLFIAMLSLTACKTTEWTRPGTSSLTQRQDWTLCSAEAYRSAPVDLYTVVIPGHTEYGLEECTKVDGKKKCSSKDRWVPTEKKEVDRNDDARSDIRNDCMRKRGYREETTRSYRVF